MKKTLISLFAAVGVSVALSLGANPVAAATPTPDAGPTAGGTRLRIGPVGVTFTAVSAGTSSVYALGDDGAVYAWGDNEYGQLGTGTTVDAHAPVKVTAPAGLSFTAVSAGSLSAYALGDDGAVYAWGDNEYGQLGTGTTGDAHTPVKVTAPAGVSFTAVSAAGPSAYAVGDDGKTYAWGFNGYGQLGTGTTLDAHAPVAVALPAGVRFTTVSAGSLSAYALGDDGKTYAWGDNDYGQLGTGDTANAHAPVRVSVPAGVRFASVSGGSLSAYALGDDGKTYAWGDNDYGQLGTGTTVDAHAPVRVSVPAGVRFASVSAGVSSAYALGDDGKTYAWGDNDYGQLGTGGTANAHAPVTVAVPAGVRFASVAGGSGSAYARGQDGDTYAWGDNDYGQLGRGDTANARTPVEVAAGVEVTGVLFGSLPGTAVSSQGGKTWTVTSPAHRSGTVSLSVSYTQFGERKSLTAGSFTFGKAPVVTENPASQTVSPGDSLTLTAAADGDETPTVRWQSRTPDGNWADIPDATAPQYKTNPIRTSQTYRAVFANALGTATTTPATITIATPTPPPPTPPTPAPSISSPAPLAVATGDLAATGSTIGLLGPLAALLLLASGIIAVRHRHWTGHR